uniref:Secreted protein n=1 Tax=Steinernema glaseri TaxID=37863 RepID=A0A1I7Z222_9BILA
MPGSRLFLFALLIYPVAISAMVIRPCLLEDCFDDCICPLDEEPSPSAVRPIWACCWCPPCVPRPCFPFMCPFCICPVGQVADSSAMRPPFICCWCPPCIPVVTPPMVTPPNQCTPPPVTAP